MQYSDGHCQILLLGSTLNFSGKLEQSDYTKFEAFLHEAAQLVPSSTCVVDLRNLMFMNSRGLRVLANFMKESSQNFELRINRKFVWQQKTIPMLRYLRPNRIAVT